MWRGVSVLNVQSKNPQPEPGGGESTTPRTPQPQEKGGGERKPGEGERPGPPKRQARGGVRLEKAGSQGLLSRHHTQGTPRVTEGEYSNWGKSKGGRESNPLGEMVHWALPGNTATLSNLASNQQASST